MPTMQKDDAIGFRVPAALKSALEAAAKAEHRSLGQLCSLALMQFLEGRGEWPIDNRAGLAGTRKVRQRRPARKTK